MKELTNESELIAVTHDVIKNFCKEHACNLPEDYKQFLLKYNGGRFKECLFPTSDIIQGESFAMANFFYGFLAKMPDPFDMYDIYKKCNVFKNRVPKEFIPIGCDPVGNQICLCIHGQDYGKIYYWDHEEEVDEGEEPTYDNMYLVTNSFTDFINSLYEDED